MTILKLLAILTFYFSRRKLRESSEKNPWLESPDISETDSIRSLSPERSKKKSKSNQKI
jgi:hypothetical protein